jgi:hypothetical protein
VESAIRCIINQRLKGSGKFWKEQNAEAMILLRSYLHAERYGLDVTSRPLPGFPGGMLVMMNSGPRTFQIYRWDDVAAGMAEVD